MHAKLLFADAHNAGFYINSYTTKLNPGMGTVLQRLLEGVLRLHAEWAANQEQSTRPPSAYKKTMQMLSRFDTSFRRASWKRGTEMVFPMLFGHMPFNTHRCWCVYMRKAFWLGAQSWRMF